MFNDWLWWSITVNHEYSKQGKREKRYDHRLKIFSLYISTLRTWAISKDDGLLCFFWNEKSYFKSNFFSMNLGTRHENEWTKPLKRYKIQHFEKW